jgi:muramoyltetrapeptide carboxypeptidase
MAGGPYFRADPNRRYLLFTEDHEAFSTPEMTAMYLSYLEHSGLMARVTGVIFGHYSAEQPAALDEILLRLAARYAIPVVRCDDFGHGANNAILPLGVNASLDADAQTLTFTEPMTV